MVKVKICGITNVADAFFCSHAGADALGFIFSKKSPRCIAEKDAKKIISQLDPFISKVGVFLDEEKNKVADIAAALSLDTLQFHGRESPAYCGYFHDRYNVIKVFFAGDENFSETTARYSVDAYSMDIAYEEKLRGKKTLPKTALAAITPLIKAGKRIIISGGLTVTNVAAAVKLKPYAVDVASGLEEFVGKKDHELVLRFINEVKHEHP
jgi:phosphoribosylanthranilate isomerase